MIDHGATALHTNDHFMICKRMVALRQPLGHEVRQNIWLFTRVFLMQIAEDPFQQIAHSNLGRNEERYIQNCRNWGEGGGGYRSVDNLHNKFVITTTARQNSKQFLMLGDATSQPRSMLLNHILTRLLEPLPPSPPKNLAMTACEVRA